MLLIADSGSTKTDWALVENISNEIIYTETNGFNPFFHSTSYILEHILSNEVLQHNKNKIQQIRYFGAGCSSEHRNAIVENALKQMFPNAFIKVDHDIAGAVYATCQHKPGISCILGTGSNCVMFDGTSIISHTHALGYVLGDEGSGSYFGKKIARDFINKVLPPNIHAFYKQHGFTKESILEKVYNTPGANKFLASMAKPLSEFLHEEYTQQLLHEGFTEFVQQHIIKIPNAQKYPVHFVGSIAFTYQDLLKNVLSKFHLHTGIIIQKPILALSNVLK